MSQNVLTAFILLGGFRLDTPLRIWYDSTHTMKQDYVLSSFTLDPQAADFLTIACRPSGFWNWFLCKLRIQDSATLSANRRSLDFKSKSIKQFDNITVPMSRIMSASYGADKPYMYMVLAIVLLLVAVALPFFLPWWSAAIPLALALCCGVAYYTAQYFYLRLEHGDDKVFCIRFHPSIIERVSVDLEQVDKSCALIREAMLDSRVD